MSIEIPAAIATLAAGAEAEAEAQERNRELIGRVAAVLFATGSVVFAGVVALLTQLR